MLSTEKWHDMVAPYGNKPLSYIFIYLFIYNFYYQEDVYIYMFPEMT